MNEKRRGHWANREKKQFYRFLIDTLKKNEKTKADQFIALCKVQYGRTESNIKECLETLEDAGIIEILNGEITFLEDKVMM